MPRRFVLYLAVAFATIGADQITKYWARTYLPVDPAGNGIRVPVIDGYWDWVLAWNTGSAFSMFAGTGGAQIFLSAVGIIAVGVLSWMVWKARDDQKVQIAALALMAGGAVGNLIDRIAFGKVTDFVLWRYQEHTWPVFNVADVALTVAVGVFLLSGLRKEKPAPIPARR
jgi:signal peptidase II